MLVLVWAGVDVLLDALCAGSPTCFAKTSCARVRGESCCTASAKHLVSKIRVLGEQ